MQRMAEIGRQRGLKGFTADVLEANKPMLSVFRKSGLHLTMERGPGTRHMRALFRKPDNPTVP